LVPMLGKIIMPFNVNAGSLLAMLGSFGSESDAIAPTCGTHHLADFFRDQVSSDSDELRVKR
jgi:hypothetical protein